LYIGVIFTEKLSSRPISDKKDDITTQNFVNMYNKPQPRTGHELPEGE